MRRYCSSDQENFWNSRLVLRNLQENLENTFSHLFSRSSIASAKDFLPDNQGAKASEDKKALDWRISNWRSIVSVSRIFSFKATICSSKGTTMALSNSASSEAWFEDLWSYNSDHFQLTVYLGVIHITSIFAQECQNWLFLPKIKTVRFDLTKKGLKRFFKALHCLNPYIRSLNQINS